MKSVQSYGVMAALMALGAIEHYGVEPLRRPAPRFNPPPRGPITDSTKESKRAKRRRLAKEPRS